MLTMNWHFGLAQMHYTGLPIGTWIAWRDERGLRRALTNVGLRSLDAPRPIEGAADLVVMIGESETSSHWRLFGYARDTTPRMDDYAGRGLLLPLPGVTTRYAETRRSLMRFLTDAKFDDKLCGSWTLSARLRFAGYEPVLISRQKERAGTDLHEVFNGCDERVYPLSEGGDGAGFDEALVPAVRRVLAVPRRRPLALFVHFSGLHFPLEGVYPEDAGRFPAVGEPAESRIDRYDNAVRYEDEVRGRILDLLMAHPRPAMALFVSDHGESPSSRTWRDSADPDCYAVPAFLFRNRSDLAFPAADVRSIDGLTDLLLSLTPVPR